MTTSKSRSEHRLHVAGSRNAAKLGTALPGAHLQHAPQETGEAAENSLSVGTTVRTVAGAIAWLSGAAAGISAIFYVCGVLVTISNLHLLGLDPLAIRYDATFYMHRGGEFLLVTAINIAQFYFWIFAAGGVLLLFVVISKPWIRKAVAETPLRRSLNYPNFWRSLAFACLLGMLFIHVSTHLTLPSEMNVSGVLYFSTSNEPLSDADPESTLRNAIVCGKRENLKQSFALFGLQHVFIGFCLLFSWTVTRSWRWGPLLVAPFVIMFVLSSFFLPLVYGKFILDNKFPSAVIRLEQNDHATLSKAYLMNKTDNEFLLWDSKSRRIVWLPMRGVASIEFAESESLSQILKWNGGGKCKVSLHAQSPMTAG